MSRDREIDRPHRLYAVSGKQRISVIAVNRMHQRRSGDSVQTRARAQVVEHVESRGAELHFLQGDDVGVQLLQHRRSALRCELPVASDADMDIVRSYGDAQLCHVMLVRRRAALRSQAAIHQ